VGSIPKIRLVVGCALLALLVLFIVLNLERSRVNFIFGTAQMPVAFVILLSAGLGAGAALTFRFLRSVRRPPPKE
jgi:uncharacterized integral membrane protein